MAIALISIVSTGALTVWTLTRGSATTEQLRDERNTSLRESQELWQSFKALEGQVKELTRESDRRGSRLDRLEQLESRIVSLESVKSTLDTIRVELRVLQESQAKLDHLLSQLSERLIRRQESEPAQSRPGGRLPQGFP